LLKEKSFQNSFRNMSLQRHKVILNHPVYNIKISDRSIYLVYEIIKITPVPIHNSDLR